MNTPVSIEEAYRLLQQNAGAPERQEVELTEAFGHFLAEDVCADRDMPPFNRVMMDGFAVCSEDVSTTPVELDVIETVAAGQMAAKKVGRGEATRIMTGAPAPEGADAVIMIEKTEPLGEEKVRIQASVSSGQNIAPKGSDVKAGEVVLTKGLFIGPAEIGVLATVGCVQVPVGRKPRVAILGTGDELLEPGAVPGPSQIRNSNSYQIYAQAQAHGLEVEYLGIAPDEAQETKRMIQRGLEADILISTGGVSAGDKDFVGAAYKELGVQVAFEKVAIKPGKPTLFGTHGNCLVFGLPGNPVAALVCFHQFVMTAVRARMGAEASLPAFQRLPLQGGVPPGGPRPVFRPANLKTTSDGTVVTPLVWHGSGHLAACVGAGGFLFQPAGETMVDGQQVAFYPL